MGITTEPKVYNSIEEFIEKIQNHRECANKFKVSSLPNHFNIQVNHGIDSNGGLTIFRMYAVARHGSAVFAKYEDAKDDPRRHDNLDRERLDLYEETKDFTDYLRKKLQDRGLPVTVYGLELTVDLPVTVYGLELTVDP